LAQSPADCAGVGHIYLNPRLETKESHPTGTHLSLTVEYIDVHGVEDATVPSPANNWHSGGEMIAFLNYISPHDPHPHAVGIYVRMVSKGNCVRVQPHRIYTGARPSWLIEGYLKTRRRLDYSPWHRIENVPEIEGYI
jgi:hypothetical protein